MKFYFLQKIVICFNKLYITFYIYNKKINKTLY